MELEEKSISVSDCIEGALDLLASRAHAKGLELVYFNENDILFDGDETRLRQIIVNLVSNAVKFTSTGQIIVRAKVYQTDDVLCQRLRINISDSGVGISHEGMSKLFQSFTQENASVTRVYGGTGLGLAIVKRLCNLMGGDVTVESELGKGSTFTFEIRCHGCIQSSVDLECFDPIKNGSVIIHMRNRYNSELLQMYCCEWRLRPVIAETRDELKNILQEFHDIVLILTECGQDGVPNIEQQFAANIPMITFIPLGYAQSVDTPTVAKPIRKHKIFAAINELIERRYLQLRHAPKVETVRTSKGDLSNIRVLLCEDNPINQKVAIHILKNLKCDQVMLASNGQEGLDALDRHPQFDVILMDCQMPVLDGVETTKVIRRNEAWARVKIIGLTADSSTHNRDDCLSAGMDAFVSKPFKIKVLYETILKVLNT